MGFIIKLHIEAFGLKREITSTEKVRIVTGLKDIPEISFDYASYNIEEGDWYLNCHFIEKPSTEIKKKISQWEISGENYSLVKGWTTKDYMEIPDGFEECRCLFVNVSKDFQDISMRYQGGNYVSLVDIHYIESLTGIKMPKAKVVNVWGFREGAFVTWTGSTYITLEFEKMPKKSFYDKLKTMGWKISKDGVYSYEYSFNTQGIEEETEKIFIKKGSKFVEYEYHFSN